MEYIDVSILLLRMCTVYLELENKYMLSIGW